MTEVSNSLTVYGFSLRKNKLIDMLDGKFNQLHVSSISAPRQFALGSFEISLALSDVFLYFNWWL